ncbi:hypothetical protein BBBF_0190 [Bifidobacterium bifidum ATCC 29521 = JCM 1255 = DSM 20456]|uniref:Uncharacterized protein n=2 Tax=Bifidobacterium bifidum TaxID=1681 RepID=A0A286TCX2_BIFBI|nr:hypothetical protein BBBF_0190 [Bifidobacterium bifidum ATCC 29521 = JCM 1255 = DSM 20456]BBA48176.1 hypothetical protein BBJK_01704 [Bifidobacterium bifidum LMG 13195]
MPDFNQRLYSWIHECQYLVILSSSTDEPDFAKVRFKELYWLVA